MSNITYTPATKAQLEAWIDSCPRELANFVFVVTCQLKSSGDISNLGVLSMHEASTYDVLKMIDETIDVLNREKMQLVLRSLKSVSED
jgi:hypothetical protein